MRQLRQNPAPLDAETLQRFVRPGPRYTSYPPATEFKPDFSAQDAAEELARLRRDAADEPLSLYMHIPFCSSLCWYCGCNLQVSRKRERGTEYVDTLLREVDLLAEAVGPGHPVSELSLGGGSPNFLLLSDLTRLTERIRDRFTLTEDAELGLELDPRDTTEEQVRGLGNLGYKRMSVGIQDFDQAVQKAIHREQSIEKTRQLVEWSRKYGFRTFNADLVYGLPLQSPETLDRTLDAVLSFDPQRIAWFGYAHLPHLRPHQKLVERAGPLPDTAARAELLSLGLRRLGEAGFERVGMDHFAQPDDELAVAAREGRLHRNFQGYVVPRAMYLLACGATGISDSGHAFWQNHADVDTWAKDVEAGLLPVGRGVALDLDDRLRRFVIGRLMCDGELGWARVEERFDIHFEDYFAPELERLESAEYTEIVTVDRDARALVATPLGCNLIRNIAMVFDRYLARPKEAGRPRFSPTL